MFPNPYMLKRTFYSSLRILKKLVFFKHDLPSEDLGAKTCKKNFFYSYFIGFFVVKIYILRKEHKLLTIQSNIHKVAAFQEMSAFQSIPRLE